LHDALERLHKSVKATWETVETNGGSATLWKAREKSAK
jgi:hypothetical protein